MSCRTSACTLLALSPTGWVSVMPSRLRSRNGQRCFTTGARSSSRRLSCSWAEAKLRGYRAPARRGGAVRLRRLGLDTAPELSRDQREDAGRRSPPRWQACGQRCGSVRRRPRRGPVFLDIDASLVEIHSENKEQTAPTYKGGFGFHPMFCFADATGEALSGVLRPGNAGSNTAADHVRVLDEAISQLPDDVQAGHHVGEDASLVRREVVCRTDSGGTTAAFTAALRARNIGFFTSAMTNDQVQAAIFDAEGIEEVWVPALGKDGEERDGSSVCELTSLVLLSSLPSGTRLIVRREPLHPGAQRSLFPSLEYRYWGFYTDCEGEPAELDLMMRAHAHVENHIARLKDSGLCRFPFSSFEANANWMAVVMLSADLVRWFQLLCCDGYWSCARPKALRWGLFHAPGRIVRSARRSIVRILEHWPEAGILLRAYRQIEAIT